MGNINAGYMGKASIGGTTLRFTDANISVKQNVEVPDLVASSYDRNTFYYGAAIVDGSISGPVFEGWGSSILTWAAVRDSCGKLTEEDADIIYFCGEGAGNSSLNIPEILANSVTISATAGDIVNYSIDTIGAGKATYGGTTSSNETDVKKILTWDKLSLDVTGHDGISFENDMFSAIEFTINNNVTPAYKLGDTTNGLFPSELITGIRSITGTLTVYNLQGSGLTADKWDDYGTSVGNISMTIGSDATINASVKFSRLNPSSSVGPVTSTIAFVGLGDNNSLIS